VRKTYTKDFYVNGKILEATILEDPNVDDVISVEARIYAHGLAAGSIDTTRVVDRGVRDVLVRFGVVR
jgi:hypothetical protein